MGLYIVALDNKHGLNFWTWDIQKFKENSSQNKINQSLVWGGAFHSVGCKSHLDIALGLVSIFHDLCIPGYMLFNLVV